MNGIASEETAADLAAVAALLEIAEDLDVSDLLDRAAPFTLDEVMAAASVPEPGATAYLHALTAAGLVTPGTQARQFVPRPDLADLRYQAGYLSWALNANRPYLEHAAEFLRDPEVAGRSYQRDSRTVAVSSRWIGTQGFYPGVIGEIVSGKPDKIVDLGAGAAGLLVQLLTALPNSRGLALDLSAGACQEAERAAERAEVGDRLEVVNRSIESLIEDPSPVRDADVVHAGFVMHDVVSDPKTLDGVLRACRESLAEGGRLIVTDAARYVGNQRERAFSALFSYLHASSMNVLLPTKDDWHGAFARAGFSEVTSEPLRMPGSRMFIAVR